MRPADDVEQIAFDGRLVLISRRHQALMVLNETASFVWQELRARTALGAVVSQLSDCFGMPRPVVERDVQAILSAWQAAGLLGNGSGLSKAPRMASEEPPPRRVRSRTYALCGRPIRFELGDRALEDAVHPLFAPAEVEGADASDCISMYAGAGGYLVALNRGLAETRPDIEAALGLAIVHVLDLSYPEARWLAVVHAGVVAGKRGALLLPGVSGSGKSTLTAALVNAGLTYLSDDIAPLDGRSMQIRPVPFALSLKEASWPLLGVAYPELQTSPIYEDDSRRWRYLDLAARSAPLDGERLSLVVLPAYAPGAQPSLTRLGPLDALEGLIQARCWISLERSDVEALLGLLCEVPTYRLTYGSLESAVGACLDLVLQSPN